MDKRKADTVDVIVKTRSYQYHGHTFGKGETIPMDKHDVSPAVERDQIRPKVKKGPATNRSITPKENR